MKSLWSSLGDSIESKYLAWFRIIAFGLIVLEVSELYVGGYLGFVLSGTDIRFPYEFLPIMVKLESQQVGLLYAFVVASASLCAVGLFYRYATWMFTLSYSFLFFQDKLFWNNHWYLFVLIGIMAILVDMSKSYSIDVLLNPNLYRKFVPRWNYGLFAFQVAIVYFYGGVSKLNTDWLMHAEPISTFLSQRTHYPVLGIVFEQSWAPYFFAYGGLFFDLVIGFLLFWKRTWYLSIALVLIFNGLNTIIFDIGTFPFFMVGSLILFYGVNLDKSGHIDVKVDSFSINKLKLLFVGLFVCFQILFPLRQFLYSGSPSWIGICERFSWRMMIQQKEIKELEFFVYDRDLGRVSLVENDLTLRQKMGMVVFPEMIAQYAKGMRNHLQKNGPQNIEIKANVQVSMNGKPVQFLVDRNYDISREDRKLWEAPKYILPEAN